MKIDFSLLKKSITNVLEVFTSVVRSFFYFKIKKKCRKIEMIFEVVLVVATPGTPPSIRNSCVRARLARSEVIRRKPGWQELRKVANSGRIHPAGS
jgi:hypothetical protein